MAIIRSIPPKLELPSEDKTNWIQSLLMQDMMIRDKERSKKAIEKYNKSIKKQKSIKMKKFITLITFFALAFAFTSCSNSYEATTRKMQRTGFKPYHRKASPRIPRPD